MTEQKVSVDCSNEKIEINVVPRMEEYLNPNMPNVDKVAKMARICYRNEKDNDHETDVRIIKRCIESGHESILEHGAISLFIHNEKSDDTSRFSAMLQGNPPVDFNRVWRSSITDAEMKYCERFMDPELFNKFDPDSPERRLLPCYIADIRAWRQILREKMFIATSKSDQLLLALLLKVGYEMDKADGEHIFFGDIIADWNEMLKNETFQKAMILNEDAEKNLKEFTVESIANFYFTVRNTVIAGQSADCATFSVILTTDRATTHQLVRHRKNVAYSQESQRYVNYDKKGYRVIPMTVEPSKFPPNFIDDYDKGSVSSNSRAYALWIDAIKNAFIGYHQLQHAYDGEADPIVLPSETCRGVLPNDTATKIGVTWFRSTGFINFCYWRLDSHAQYAIRSTLARIVVNAVMRDHPFFAVIKTDIVLKWLKQIKEQKLLNDNEIIDKSIDLWTKRLEAINKYVAEQMKKQESAEGKEGPAPSVQK